MVPGSGNDSDDGAEGVPKGLSIRTLTVDDYSTVRYIHASSIRLNAAHMLADTEIQAFTEHVYSDAYASQLARARLVGAIIDGELIGTAGWSIGDDSGSGARIFGLHVRPLFTKLGIGQRLLETVESAAHAAGFDTFSARATVNSTTFFERHGYVVTSHGHYAISPDRGLPVAYMRKDMRGRVDRSNAADGLVVVGPRPIPTTH
jgi:GNAT superfamily N-acetyltransferase